MIRVQGDDFVYHLSIWERIRGELIQARTYRKFFYCVFSLVQYLSIVKHNFVCLLPVLAMTLKGLIQYKKFVVLEAKGRPVTSHYPTAVDRKQYSIHSTTVGDIEFYHGVYRSHA